MFSIAATVVVRGDEDINAARINPTSTKYLSTEAFETTFFSSETPLGMRNGTTLKNQLVVTNTSKTSFTPGHAIGDIETINASKIIDH